jgi:hypothetical protein
MPINKKARRKVVLVSVFLAVLAVGIPAAASGQTLRSGGAGGFLFGIH